MEMDREVVQRLLREGGTFICLGVPKGCEFGIDMKYITTEEKFNGIKMIPPGVHFIYYSTENSHGDQSPRVGFLHYFKKGEVVVKKWDAKNEEFINEESEDVICRLKANLKMLDRYLGAYPFDVWDKWKCLSSKISEKLVEKVTPICGRVYSALELKAPAVDKSSNSDTQVSKRQTSKLFLCDEIREDFLPKLEAVEGTELRFLKIPEKCYPENSTPSEITKHSLDSSYLFECILSQHDRTALFVQVIGRKHNCTLSFRWTYISCFGIVDTNPTISFIDVLGEIQLAFICFLLGCSFEAFEHWKKLIGIICSCDEAISKYPDLFSEFIPILNFQLQEVQEDFLVDIVAGNNFVYRILRIFFRNLQSSSVNERLKAKGKRFQEHLTEKLLWDFSDIHEEDEDDLPVVVNIS